MTEIRLSLIILFSCIWTRTFNFVEVLCYLLLHFTKLWFDSKLFVTCFHNMISLLTWIVTSSLYPLCPGINVPIIDVFPPNVWCASKHTPTSRCSSLPTSFLTFSAFIETHIHLVWFSSTSFGKCSHRFMFDFGRCLFYTCACGQMGERRDEVTPRMYLSLGTLCCFYKVSILRWILQVDWWVSVL